MCARPGSGLAVHSRHFFFFFRFPWTHQSPRPPPPSCHPLHVCYPTAHTPQGRSGTNDALTITQGADPADPRLQKHGAPTPSSVRHPSPSIQGMGGAGAMTPAGQRQPEEEETVGLNMDMDGYAEVILVAAER